MENVSSNFFFTPRTLRHTAGSVEMLHKHDYITERLRGAVQLLEGHLFSYCMHVTHETQTLTPPFFSIIQKAYIMLHSHLPLLFSLLFTAIPSNISSPGLEPLSHSLIFHGSITLSHKPFNLQRPGQRQSRRC